MRKSTKAATAVLALAVLGTTGYLTHTALAEGDGLGRFANQKIDWHKCQLDENDEVGAELDAAGAQCGEVTVPLDYRKPNGRTIEVAMSRLEGSDKKHKIGSMLLNTGGPAGEGLDYVLPVSDAMGKLSSRFDLIGMDPRFVGRSNPIDCGWDVGTWVRSAGTERDGFDEIVDMQADLAERCERTKGDLLPHVTTRNTARDMDLIRRVLGERKLSYLGYSYGTYLGSVYTQMFPKRADRVVLDGAVDPDRYGATMFGDAAGHAENALKDWAKWAAKRDAEYGLGATQDEVVATVDSIMEAAAEEPLRIGEYELDDSAAPIVLLDGLSDDREPSNTKLAEAVATMHTAATQGSAKPGPELEGMLGFVLTGAESKYGSAQASILCGDVDVPTDPDWYWNDIEEHRADEPRFGPVYRDISPCASWSTEPIEEPTTVDNDVPALVVAATGDPMTPYEHAEALHGKLSESRLLTLDGARVHGVYGEYGNSCIDKRVNKYLASGKLPSGNPTC
ncbi:alpha/beta hydrolase [Stackebrandtia nassauensis]|uniref:TAP domain protein n=1 Tax=Stackebrandtia nassauensis (strain DSM 44728 / CIP 108903 / NRRL B-16338 / NBRC 102104 / LLR-40K-21) TaxID=446470 RepID=D3Q7M8_STANL|nr:alpha/beta hydrolase [Stackebrandtia nassauensis]ADD44370.1 TAP domain protein [Stackebrandtia nassauensis DSM 44728]